jgi:hypothetical protein
LGLGLPTRIVAPADHLSVVEYAASMSRTSIEFHECASWGDEQSMRRDSMCSPTLGTTVIVESTSELVTDDNLRECPLRRFVS